MDSLCDLLIGHGFYHTATGEYRWDAADGCTYLVASCLTGGRPVGDNPVRIGMYRLNGDFIYMADLPGWNSVRGFLMSHVSAPAKKAVASGEPLQGVALFDEQLSNHPKYRL
jgi:hypothetical protein